MTLTKKELNELLWTMKEIDSIAKEKKRSYRWIATAVDCLDQSNISKDLSDEEKKFLSNWKRTVVEDTQETPLILSRITFGGIVIYIKVMKNKITIIKEYYDNKKEYILKSSNLKEILKAVLEDIKDGSLTWDAHLNIISLDCLYENKSW